MPFPPGARLRLSATPFALLVALCLLGVRIQSQSASPLAHGFVFTAEQLRARVQAFQEGLAYVPGELLVKFKAGYTTAQQARSLSVLRGGLLPAQTRWLGDVLLVTAPDEDPSIASNLLARQPEIEWAQPNYISRLHGIPNDPSFSRQWNLTAINMPVAWDISGTRSSAVTVAVIDSGVTAATNSYAFPLWDGSRIANFLVPFRVNPDLAGSRFANARDFIFWNGPVLDMVGHGTHVAGTVLQETGNALGLAGIAPHARLMPLKACVGYWEFQIVRSALGIPGYEPTDTAGGCETGSVIAAIRYAADSGAHVINLSFGGPFPSPAYLDALRYAVQRGAFVSIAMGNEFEDGNPTEYPAAYAAQIDGVMSVGATGRSGRRAYYSNTGAHIEIVAPGGDFRDGGLGGVVYQSGLFDPDFDQFSVIVPRFDRYYDDPSQGTSMAAPHVAGVAALLRAQGITSAAAIEAAIRRFAVDLGPTGRDNEYGHGLIDARAALRGLGVAR